MVMAIWRKPPKKATVDIETDELERRLRAAAAQLDVFVASLRMEIDEPEGTSDDRPSPGK
jgi:hypothetical protein